MLPGWIDVDFVRGVTTGGVIGLGVAGLIVLIVVRGFIGKIITLALIAALAVGALTYRTSLEHCVKTCSCSLGHEKITINGHGCAGKR